MLFVKLLLVHAILLLYHFFPYIRFLVYFLSVLNAVISLFSLFFSFSPFFFFFFFRIMFFVRSCLGANRSATLGCIFMRNHYES